MFELRRLRLFTIVAEEGSSTGAACRLHLAQSAVSQQMSFLEDETGLTLIQRCRRSGRRITLTPAGQVLLQQARHLLRDVATIEQEIDRLGGHDNGAIERHSRTRTPPGHR